MPRGGRSPGARHKPGQLNKLTIEAIKHIGPVGERAIGLLVEAMQNPKAPWSCRIQAADMVAAVLSAGVSLEATRRPNDLSLAEFQIAR
jgi:hypothetical protein